MVETLLNWTWILYSRTKAAGENRPGRPRQLCSRIRRLWAVSLLPLLVLAGRCGGEGGEAAGLPPLHAVLEAAHWGLLGLPGGRGYATRHS